MLNAKNIITQILIDKGYQVELNEDSLQFRFCKDISYNFFGIIQFESKNGYFRYGVNHMFLKDRWVENLGQLESLLEAAIAEYESWP